MGASFFVKGSPNDTILEVDGQKVPLRQYWIHYNQSVDPSKPLDEAGRNAKRDETIRDLVQSVVFQREVDHYKIRVPDAQVAATLTQIPAFQTNHQFNPQRYMEVLGNQLRMTPKEFEDEQRLSIGFFKLRWLIQSAIKVTDQEMAFSGGYPEFAKVNAVEETSDHKKRRRSDAEIRELYRKKLWDDKTLYCFNQWLTQLGQGLRVKPHLDVLDAGGQS
jgi:hypothetical protein